MYNQLEDITYIEIIFDWPRVSIWFTWYVSTFYECMKCVGLFVVQFGGAM